MARQGFVGHTTTILPDGNVCIWSATPMLLETEEYGLDAIADSIINAAVDKKFIFVDWLDYFKPKE